MIRCSFLLISIVLSVSALGQPVISSVSGDFSEGNTVTIFGSGFGEKPVASPVLWDDLNSGAYSNLAEGEIVPTRGGTHGHPSDPSAPFLEADGPGFPASTVFRQTGRVDGRPVYALTESSGFLTRPAGLDGDSLYLNWWMKSSNINSTSESGSNRNKILRLWNGPTNANGYINLTPTGIVHTTGTETGEVANAYVSVYPAEGVWTNIEVWTDTSIGSTSGQDGGEILKVWRDGELLYSSENLGSSGENPQGAYTWVQALGMDASSGVSLADGENNFGDIYVDNTQARVFISNSASWSDAQSSHNEIQIPQSWGPDQIEIRVNPGTFSTGDYAYLYIVDAEGQVNSNGLAVEIASTQVPGVSEGPGPPGRPTLIGGDHEPGGGSSKK